jgi:hypothetical protein
VGPQTSKRNFEGLRITLVIVNGCEVSLPQVTDNLDRVSRRFQAGKVNPQYLAARETPDRDDHFWKMRSQT